MWARNLLFVGISIAGLVAIGDQLLRRNRIDQPASLEPGRFALANSSSTNPAAASGNESWPAERPPGDIGVTLARLNAEFRQHWQAKGLTAASRADDLT